MKKFLISLIFLVFGFSQAPVTTANLPYYIGELYFNRTHIDSILPADSTTMYIEGYITTALLDTANMVYKDEVETITGDWTFNGRNIYGDLNTFNDSVYINNILIEGNKISTIAGTDLNITQLAGQDIVLDSHWEIDGTEITALTNNNSTIIAYTGKNITIEDVTFDGGVVDGVSDLTISGTFTDGTFSSTNGAFTGIVSLSDGTASWSSSSLSGFVNITATAQIQAEHLKSTDDIEATDDIILYDGSKIGISGNELITFNASGTINITGADFDVDGNATASSYTSDDDITATDNLIGEDAFLSDSLEVGTHINSNSLSVSDSAFIDTLSFSRIFGLDSLNIDSLNFVPNLELSDSTAALRIRIESKSDSSLVGYLAQDETITGLYVFSDSAYIDTLQFSRIYGLDSLNIDSLKFVPDLEFSEYKTALDTGNIAYLPQDNAFTGRNTYADLTTFNDTVYVDGKLGVGTSSPSTLLEVQGTVDASFELDGGATSDAYIRFSQGGNPRAYIGYDDTGDLLKLNGQDGLSSYNDLVINSSGNVGIGTDSPDKLLGLSDGTDEFSLDVTSDKLTIWNDAGTPVALAYIDSAGDVGIGTSPVTGAQLTLPQENDAVTPTLAFGDGDTGFYESTDDVIYLTVGGVRHYELSGEGIIGRLSTGFNIRDMGTTATTPIYSFKNDDDTGIGSAGADVLNLIAGGTNMLELVEDTADTARINADETEISGNLAVTGDITGNNLSGTNTGNQDSTNIDALGFVPDAELTTHKTSSDHDGRYYTETEIGTWRNSTTQTEMGYVHGVTSDIQTQFGAKADSGAVFHLAQDETVTGRTSFSDLTTFNDTVYVNGKLGIGTASPDSTLHVVGSGHFTTNLLVDGDITEDGHDVYSKPDTTGNDIQTKTDNDALYMALADEGNYVVWSDTTNQIATDAEIDADITTFGSGANHDSFSDFVANEHIDWTSDQGATNIHAGNYTDTNTQLDSSGIDALNFVPDLEFLTFKPTVRDTVQDEIDSTYIDGKGFVPDAELTTHKTSSDHDGRYYTENETDTLLGAKADTTDNATRTNITNRISDHNVANEHIDWTSASSNFSTSGTLGSGAITSTDLFTLNQSADSDGIQINGYDDQSGKSLSFNIGADGTASIASGGTSSIVVTSQYNLINVLGDNAGAREFRINDSDGSTVSTIDSDGNAMVKSLNNSDGNITNVGDISLDTISSDAGTSIGVTLGSDAGDDFNIDSGGFVYEGDNNRVGIGTASPDSTFHTVGSGHFTTNLLVDGDITGNNLSGTNTGDQDLSSLMLKAAFDDSLEARVKYLFDYGNNLETAISSIGATPTTLNITTTPDSLSGNVTSPSTLTLNWSQGCILTDNTDTLTLSNSPQAGVYQIFGDNLVVQSTGASLSRPEWFGAERDSTTDDAWAIQKAVDFLPIETYVTVDTTRKRDISGGGTVEFTNGFYLVGTTVELVPNMTLEGNHATVVADDDSTWAADSSWTVDRVVITNAGDGYDTDDITISFSGGGGSDAEAVGFVQIDVDGDDSDTGDSTVVEIYVTNGGYGYTSAPTVTINDGSNSPTTTATATAYLADGAMAVFENKTLSGSYTVQNLFIRNVTIECDSVADGIQLNTGKGGKVENVIIYRPKYDGIRGLGLDHFTFENNTIYEADRYGFHFSRNWEATRDASPSTYCNELYLYNNYAVYSGVAGVKTNEQTNNINFYGGNYHSVEGSDFVLNAYNTGHSLIGVDSEHHGDNTSPAVVILGGSGYNIGLNVLNRAPNVHYKWVNNVNGTDVYVDMKITASTIGVRVDNPNVANDISPFSSAEYKGIRVIRPPYENTAKLDEPADWCRDLNGNTQAGSTRFQIFHPKYDVWLQEDLEVDGTITTNGNYPMEGYATGRNIDRVTYIRVYPGTTPNTHLSIDFETSGGDSWNTGTFVDTTDVQAGNVGVYVELSADGKDLTIKPTETVLSTKGVFIQASKLNTADGVTRYIGALESSGNIKLNIYNIGNIAKQSWLPLLDASDSVYFYVQYVTSD